MLIRFLYFIFILVFIRFVVRLVREILRLGSSRDEEPRISRDDPTRGHRVVDVDYEEVKPGKDPGKGAR